MPIKYEVKPSALLTSRHCAKCFILCIARDRSCFSFLKNLPISTSKPLTYFNICTYMVTSAPLFQVRQYRMISYANTSVRRLILAIITWIHHLFHHLQYILHTLLCFIGNIYCILHGWIKGYNSSTTDTMCEVGS